VGDQLLMKVAERALTTLRPADTIARIGGDEFVIVAEGLRDVRAAKHLAERICASIEVPFDLDGEAIVCTVSAGIATTLDSRHSGQGLLQEADLAPCTALKTAAAAGPRSSTRTSGPPPSTG
jgi:diguanylate cyclase (GGDEF)-like protein